MGKSPGWANSHNPENSIEDSSVIARRTASFRSGLDHKRFEESPFGIYKRGLETIPLRTTPALEDERGAIEPLPV